MRIEPLEALAVEWRQEAEVFRRRGALALADTADSYAADLEGRLIEWQLEALTLEAAAEESGYSYSALQKQIAGGRLENVGSKGRPRVRRKDLPTKGRRCGETGLAEAVLLKRLGS